MEHSDYKNEKIERKYINNKQQYINNMQKNQFLNIKNSLLELE